MGGIGAGIFAGGVLEGVASGLIERRRRKNALQEIAVRAGVEQISQLTKHPQFLNSPESIQDAFTASMTLMRDLTEQKEVRKEHKKTGKGPTGDPMQDLGQLMQGMFSKTYPGQEGRPQQEVEVPSTVPGLPGKKETIGVEGQKGPIRTRQAVEQERLGEIRQETQLRGSLQSEQQAEAEKRRLALGEEAAEKERGRQRQALAGAGGLTPYQRTRAGLQIEGISLPPDLESDYQVVPNIMGPDNTPSTLIIDRRSGKERYIESGKLAQYSPQMRTAMEVMSAVHPDWKPDRVMREAGAQLLKKMQKEGMPMDPETATFLARAMMVAGPGGIPMGLGAQVRIPVYKELKRQADAIGKTPEEMTADWAAYDSNKAALKQLTTLKEATEAYSEFVGNQARRMVASSENFIRSNRKFANTPLLVLKQQFGTDPAVAGYLLLINQVHAEFTKMTQSAASAANPPVRAQAEMDKILDGSATPAQIIEMVNVMDMERRDKIRAFISQSKELRGELSGKPEKEKTPEESDRITVTDSNGKVGTIPRNQLSDAKKQGYKVLPAGQQ